MTLRDLYPGQDVLAQRGHWDDATRQVVMDRVHNVPSFRFFDDHQRATLEALCGVVIPQDHRPPDRRVPIAPRIDQRCYTGQTDGFRLDDMPPNPVAWKWALEGLDQASETLLGTTFADADDAGRRRVIDAVRAGDPPGEIWRVLPPKKWWSFVGLRQIAGTYYAHPYAWDEIGFGGPAYPRGYFALNFGAPEPWEAKEVGPPPPRVPISRRGIGESGGTPR